MASWTVVGTSLPVVLQGQNGHLDFVIADRLTDLLSDNVTIINNIIRGFQDEEFDPNECSLFQTSTTLV